MTPTVITVPAAYLVTCVPPAAPESDHFHIHVERTGVDTWQVRWNGRTWNRRTGEWDFAEHRWADYRFTGPDAVSEALELAAELAPTLTVNGYTVGYVLAAMKEREQ